MKTKILLSIVALLLIFSAFSQKPTIELTFTATYDSQHVPLESILIENLTQGGDITLFQGDTVYPLIYTHIHDNGSSTENGFYVFQNYPNPFKQKTSVDLFLPEKEGINISVLDILGRELTHFKNTLNKGYHTFTFYPGNEKYYLLTVTGERARQTIKMLNAGYNLASASQCRIVYTHFNGSSEKLKSQKAITELIFSLGDTLRFTGFAKTLNEVAGSAVIEDAPTTDTLYEFEIREGIRCPGTPTVTDIEGNIYSTVQIGWQIGGQCWMQENLKTTTYKNGTPIPNIPDDTEWSSLTSGAYVWYDNDSSWKDLYGAIYNGHTVIDTNGLCPIGWHVPSDDEWTELTDYLGGVNAPNGDMLKSCREVNSYLYGNCNTTEHPRWEWWDDSIYGTDDYGFSGLPGGLRWYDAPFAEIGETGLWWSSTPSNSYALWNRYLLRSISEVGIIWGTKKYGLSVRCIKDLSD